MEKKMIKLNKDEVKTELENITKKVFLANQHKVMEAIAKEIGIKKEVLYFAFVKNQEIRNKILQILQRQLNLTN